MTELAAHLILLSGFCFFSWRRLMRFLHLYQQEEYDAGRFARWLIQSRAYDRKATSILLLGGALQLVGIPWPELPVLLAAAGLAFVGWLEPDVRKTGKKPLVMTQRAKRILRVAAGLAATIGLMMAVTRVPILAWTIPAQLLPLALCAATLALAGHEKRLNERFINEARDRLRKLKPVTVAITGSFGKTSVKHILGHLLSTHAPTLITPGSVNTELGISRVVREQLTSRERFFVCEMGAYGIGSIARLCRLAPPDIAVITAIGTAHYERFRSLEAVASAKFEIAEAVMKRGGPLVVAHDVLSFPAAAAFVSSHRDRTIVVGADPTSDVRLSEAHQTPAGLRVTLHWRGEDLPVQTPLFGGHHATNIGLAFAVAVALGLAPRDIVLSLSRTPQIRHRCEIRRHPSGATLIDDAYNSNSVGFANAMATLDLLRKPGGRRILITPGMLELGTAHDSEHTNIGEIAARHVDILVPIMPTRLKTMIDAFCAHTPHGEVRPFQTFVEAASWLAGEARPADAILIENDLPDLHEHTLAL